MYYNTNNESGDTLKSSKTKTLNQENLVLHVFKTNPKINLSPDDVQGVLVDDFQAAFPITSIRRSITNLTNSNKLKKTNKMKQGVWGKKTHTWILR